MPIHKHAGRYGANMLIITLHSLFSEREKEGEFDKSPLNSGVSGKNQQCYC